MLEAINLQCERGERTLFTRLNFTVAAGSLLRIAGPNGTGKTSLLRILCGLLEPTVGEVRWRGQNVRRHRDEYFGNLVYVGHLNGIKDELTVAENLIAAHAIAGHEVDPAALRSSLDAVGLLPFEKALARSLSQGQRRRVALARLFAAQNSALWILDEPFVALDQRGVRALSTVIGQHVRHGNTVVLVTHQDVAIDAPRQQDIELSEAAQPADQTAC